MQAIRHQLKVFLKIKAKLLKHRAREKNLVQWLVQDQKINLLYGQRSDEGLGRQGEMRHVGDCAHYLGLSVLGRDRQVLLSGVCWKASIYALPCELWWRLYLFTSDKFMLILSKR